MIPSLLNEDANSELRHDPVPLRVLHLMGEEEEDRIRVFSSKLVGDDPVPNDVEKIGRGENHSIHVGVVPKKVVKQLNALGVVHEVVDQDNSLSCV